MLRSHIELVTLLKRNSFIQLGCFSYIATLSPSKITELLCRNEINLGKKGINLPTNVKSIECNQLASNSPIEDRLRVSSLHLPGCNEPTLIFGVFDGHGGGVTADLISRRLFNYIALALHPEPKKLKITNEVLKNILIDHHASPRPIEDPGNLRSNELISLSQYKEEISDGVNIAAKLKTSFKRCDDDLSLEIQKNLTGPFSNQNVIHYYLSAAVSGCCAIVMVIHQGLGYIASTGDCRAVLGIHEQPPKPGDPEAVSQAKDGSYKFNAVELNDEHNCDNINEIKRLDASHPKSEQNTMIKHNRLLGHLMPFRAFGDFNYKWPVDLIKACGITRAFGPGVIPSNYLTPPYLIAEPDVTEIRIVDRQGLQEHNGQRYLVIATDGLWELFESSRDVIETIVDHSINAKLEQFSEIYDENLATHILRSALRSGAHQDCGVDVEELKRLYHIRLESTLTLPQSVVRNFRDDISIVVLKLD